MSEPTRYYPAGDGVVRTDPKGPLVNYHYYEEIKAENARIKDEVERLTELFRKTERLMLLDGEYEATKVGTYARLEAQVERLTKAGDAMVEIVNGTYCVKPPQALIDWRAAKEGKQ